MTDQEIVEKALKRLKAKTNKFGFQRYDHQLAIDALEAFERLMKERKEND